jgi:hypothetical protein
VGTDAMIFFTFRGFHWVGWLRVNQSDRVEVGEEFQIAGLGCVEAGKMQVDLVRHQYQVVHRVLGHVRERGCLQVLFVRDKALPVA